MKVITGVGGWPSAVQAQAQRAEAEGLDCITCGAECALGRGFGGTDPVRLRRWRVTLNLQCLRARPRPVRGCPPSG